MVTIYATAKARNQLGNVTCWIHVTYDKSRQEEPWQIMLHDLTTGCHLLVFWDGSNAFAAFKGLIGAYSDTGTVSAQFGPLVPID